ncbi:MAG: hypothetical protein ACYTHJ_22455 [Planctomycetota bacterium]|jgi:hypothetical protein
MRFPVPTALAAVVVVASCAAAVVAFFGDGWFEEIEPAIEQSAVIKTEPSVPAAPVPIIAADKLEIDLERQRVLIPNEGWMSAADFWEIYYNEPQRLPGDIDFQKLLQLEKLTGQAPEEDPVDPPQLPDSSDRALDLALDPSSDPSLDPSHDPSLDHTLDSTLDPARDPDRAPVWDPARDAALNPA